MYNIKNSYEFNKKFEKEQLKASINGPSILLNKDGTIKKIPTRNDAFYFSYSPLACEQSLFGYNLENLNKKTFRFRITFLLLLASFWEPFWSDSCQFF